MGLQRQQAKTEIDTLKLHEQIPVHEEGQREFIHEDTNNDFSPHFEEDEDQPIAQTESRPAESVIKRGVPKNTKPAPAVVAIKMSDLLAIPSDADADKSPCTEVLSKEPSQNDLKMEQQKQLEKLKQVEEAKAKKQKELEEKTIKKEQQKLEKEKKEEEAKVKKEAERLAKQQKLEQEKFEKLQKEKSKKEKVLPE